MPKEKNKENKISRPPVVVVMGHIDHGKSTLLDYIRKSKVAEGEEGGITQHVSAYEALCEVTDSANKKVVRKITFLDTPGHEAFKSVRESGSKVADIAVLVVSAEDGVKPQTLEALECIKRDKLPFVVAINKIDKPNANIDKTKQELAEAEIAVEGWGGTVPAVAISAKTGQGVNELLETILLQSDIEGISGNPSLKATGFVLESNRDARKGVSATLIVKNGTLKKGMFVVAHNSIAPVRSIEDFKGESKNEASLSEPVSVGGWNKIPESGIPWNSFDSRQDAEVAVIEFEKNQISEAHIKKDESGVKESGTKIIPIIVKADTLGSQKAVEYELSKLSSERVALKIISPNIGPINENDVKFAISSPETIIIGFNVGIDSTGNDFALRNNIKVNVFKIIYELLDFVRDEMKKRTPKEVVEEVTGTAKIIRVFSSNKNKRIVGGVVEEGELHDDEIVKIFRREAEIGEGKIKELQSQKIKARSVAVGKEFGMLIDSKTELVAGDRISGFKKVER